MASAADMERGMCFMNKGEPVKISRKEVVAVGTHSHTKLKFFVKSIFGGGEKIVILSHNDKVDLVDISRKQAQVISKTPKTVHIMDTHSYETLEAEISPELLEQINEGDTVIFINYQGKNSVIEIA